MADQNIYQMTDTWNNGATDWASIQMDVTDSASLAASRLIDLKVGGNSKFKVQKDGSVFFTNSDAGANGVVLTSYHNSATPAAADVPFKLLVQGEDSAGNTEDYGAIQLQIDDPTSTSEDASFVFRLVVAGTLTTLATLGGSELQLGTNVALDFAGTGAGQTRANLGCDLLSAVRNKLINGDFLIWQRATSQTSSGYGSDDRWINQNSGSTKTHSRQTHTLGQTDVPGNPTYFSRTAVTTVAGASNFVNKLQAIEDVSTLSGRDVTVTFWAKADASKNIALEMVQNFGTGGAPSTAVTGIGSQLIPLTTSWQKFSKVITVPSVSGKTLGTNGDSALSLYFWFDAGSSLNARTASLGQQSGTFDISHVSVVEGNATAETDPFSARLLALETELCYRYFERSSGNMEWTNPGNSATVVQRLSVFFSTVKRGSPTGAVSVGIGNASVAVTTPSHMTFATNAGGMQQNVWSWTADAEL